MTLLAALKCRPHLERHHCLLKGDQLVVPVFSWDPARVERPMTCHFIALLIQALMELEARRAMARRGMDAIALYPKDRDASPPGTVHMIGALDGPARHHLFDTEGNLVQTSPPTLTPLQSQLLDRFGWSASVHSWPGE